MAVKQIRLDVSPEVQAAFVGEAVRLQELRHPHIGEPAVRLLCVCFGRDAWEGRLSHAHVGHPHLVAQSRFL